MRTEIIWMQRRTGEAVARMVVAADIQEKIR
jgi:hypothetical protein